MGQCSYVVVRLFLEKHSQCGRVIVFVEFLSVYPTLKDLFTYFVKVELNASSFDRVLMLFVGWRGK